MVFLEPASVCFAHARTQLVWITLWIYVTVRGTSHASMHKKTDEKDTRSRDSRQRWIEDRPGRLARCRAHVLVTHGHRFRCGSSSGPLRRDGTRPKRPTRRTSKRPKKPWRASTTRLLSPASSSPAARFHTDTVVRSSNVEYVFSDDVLARTHARDGGDAASSFPLRVDCVPSFFHVFLFCF